MKGIWAILLVVVLIGGHMKSVVADEKASHIVKVTLIRTNELAVSDENIMLSFNSVEQRGEPALSTSTVAGNLNWKTGRTPMKITLEAVSNSPCFSLFVSSEGRGGDTPAEEISVGSAARDLLKKVPATTDDFGLRYRASADYTDLTAEPKPQYRITFTLTDI